MKLLQSIVTELQEAKKAQVATKPGEQEDQFGLGDDIFRNRDANAPPSVGAKKDPAIARQQAQNAARAAAGADMSRAPRMNHAKMAELAAEQGDEDDFEMPAWAMDADDEVEPEGTNKEIAVKDEESTAIRANGIKADWMTVEQLPGYMQAGIRAVGRTVFKSLTKTPLQDIHILANLGGQGPTEMLALNTAARTAQQTSHSEQDVSMGFGDIIPGYAPKVKMYTGPNDTYLVVQDDMGKYVYSWPSKDTKNAFVKKLGNDKPQLK